MQKSTSLENFIKTYVNNKLLSDTAESYESWLKKSGINSQLIYDRDLKDAETEYHKSKSEYGSRAEDLAEIGLSSSGYSDYLNAGAYSAMQKSKDYAKNRYIENENKNARGYADYLKSKESEKDNLLKDYIGILNSMDKEQSTLYGNVIKNIASAGITDYETAYGYASNIGLSEELADSAARTATDEARRTRDTKIMETVISRTMTESQAKQYALSMGLTEEEANRIATYAKNINELIHSSDFAGGDYGNILEDFKNQSK